MSKHDSNGATCQMEHSQPLKHMKTKCTNAHRDRKGDPTFMVKYHFSNEPSLHTNITPLQRL